MQGKKFLSVLLSAVFLISTMGSAVAATPETVQAKLEMVESDTYGQPQTGSIMERINKLEKDYDGKHRTGSMMARTNAIYSSLYENAGAPALLAELNGIEWTIRHEVSAEPVETRVTDMETEVSGKTSEGTYNARIRKLADFAFGANALPIELTTVTGNTLLSGRPRQGTFVITVPGYTAGLQRQSVFLQASSAATPTTDIPLLEGVSTVHDVQLAYGARTATVENSYTAITYRTAAGGFIVDPPDPTPRILRFAILYVPGDTKCIPDNVRGKSGK